MTKVFITGITGFVGKHLANALLKTNKYRVYGTSLSDQDSKEIELIKLNLLDEDKTEQSITKANPDYLIHLAALTSPAKSFQSTKEYFENNINAQLNVLEAVKKLDNCRTIIVSSAEIYGMVKPEDLPLDENTSLNPTSPYAVSKIAQDYLGLQYFNTFGTDIVRVRPFNHIGPGQSPDFVVSSFAKQIVDIEKGKKEKIIQVGNLESKRDFTDVRDVAAAYIKLLEQGTSGEVYNIGSGTSHKIQSILDSLLSLSKEDIAIEIDKKRFKPSDTPDMICNYSRLHEQTGWKPTIPLEQTLKDTLDYWRNIS